MSLMNIDSHLRNQRIRCGKLCQCVACNCELTDTDYTNSELREGENAAGKLTDGEYAFGWDWSSARSVFE